MVAPKIANRRHAWTLSAPGGGRNQIARATASVITRAMRLRRSAAAASSTFSAGRTSASLASEGCWVEDFIDLRVGQNVFLPNQPDDSLVFPHRLGGELGRLVVADD